MNSKRIMVMEMDFFAIRIPVPFLSAILTLVLLLIIATGCQPDAAANFKVQGTFTHAAGKRLMLAELPFNLPNRMVVDSATLDSTGAFSMSAIQKQEGLYQLFVQDGPGILLINDTENITLFADAENPGTYIVKGSQASQSIKSLYEKYTMLDSTAKAATQLAASMLRNKKMPDSLRQPYITERDRKQKQVSEFLTAYLGMEKNATAQYYALGIAIKHISRNDWTAALNKALEQHPNHAGLTLMKVSLGSANAQANQGKALVGKPLPVLALPDTAGKELTLPPYSGKWVLIDCWASWCAPCREQSADLVTLYNIYKTKNLTIVGISLDKEKAPWHKAIADDKMTWTHVSDLKFWDSKAVETLGIAALPFNVLVNPEGTVVAANLAMPALADTLAARLGN